MNELKLSLFGSPHLKKNGQPVALKRRKMVALLAYLAAVDAPQSRESVAMLLWPDAPNNLALLRRRLADLRKLLGADYLEADRYSVQLVKGNRLFIDADVFAQVAAESDPTIDQLQTAVSLHTADFLDGFHLGDSIEFDDWRTFQAQTYRQQLTIMLGQWVNQLMAVQEWETAVVTAQKWVQLNPLHESAQLQLVQLYAITGQIATAHQQVETYTKRLQDDLGVVPSPEMIQRIETILQHPTSMIVQHALHEVKRPLHTFPHPPTPFVGRTAELKTVTTRLRDNQTRFLTIVGLGGMGKTRLAIAAAQILAETGSRYVDGICFVSLTSLTSAAKLAITLADALDFTFFAGSPPEMQLQNFLRHKSMLIILDNSETMLALPDRHMGMALIAGLMETAASIHWLATSRTRLNLQGESILLLDGMPLSEEDQTDSMTLFAQCARRIQPAFAVTADNQADVRHICALVQGMPLGIEMAASWVDMLPPAEIAQEIEQSIDFLETLLHDVPARHRSIRAVFDTTWTLLSAAEQTLLTDLSIFADGFTREGAAAVANASLRQLTHLAHKSLLRRTPNGRYAIHDLLHQYTAEQLAETPAHQQQMQNKHAAFFAIFLGQQEANIKGMAQQTAVSAIEEEIANINQAWQWAIAQHNDGWLAQGLETLWYFFHMRSRYQEAKELFGAATASLHTHPNTNPLTLARLFAFEAHFSGIFGLQDQSQTAMSATLKLMADHDLAANMGSSLAFLGLIQMIWGDAAGGLDNCQVSIKVARERGEDWETAVALSVTGGAYWMSGDLVTATRYFHDSLTAYAATNDAWGMAHSHHLLGEMALLQHDLDKARSDYQIGLTLSQRTHDRHKQMQIQNRLGQIALEKVEFDAAHRFFTNSLLIAAQLGEPLGEGMAHLGLGKTAVSQQNHSTARHHLFAALPILQAAHMPPMLIEALVAIAHLFWQEYGIDSEYLTFMHNALTLAIHDELTEPHIRTFAEAFLHSLPALQPDASQPALENLVNHAISLQ
jgi:predicted ATPase/DNA-binding SARP family transcriptional activator